MAVQMIPFDTFIGFVGSGDIDLDTHAFKAVLSNTAPNPDTHDELVDITQIANGFGYVTGGVALTSVTWTETAANSGIWEWASADFEWTASGGSIGPFQYIPIYSDTSTSDKLVGYFNYGSPLTVPDGSIFRVQIGANGIFRIGVGTIT